MGRDPAGTRHVPGPDSGSSRAALEFQSVSKVFRSDAGDVVALDDINFEVPSNRFVCVVGPSGCGKSTLLRLVSGLSSISAGRVLMNGEPVNGIRSDIGFVTQDSNLFPWMTTDNNVGFSLDARNVDKTERDSIVNRLIEMVGLGGFENSYPHQLSGGMQKRASIIRTLAYDPDLILMDEPFGSLDAQTKVELQAELLKLWQIGRKTILFITHDIAEAIALGDDVIVMSARPGRIKARIPIPIDRPRDVYRIQSDRHFPELYEQIWGLLRGSSATGPGDQQELRAE